MSRDSWGMKADPAPFRMTVEDAGENAKKVGLSVKTSFV
jgi:hypothetical protein